MQTHHPVNSGLQPFNWVCPLTHLAFSVGLVSALLSLVAGELEFVIGWLNSGSFWSSVLLVVGFPVCHLVFSNSGCRVATLLNQFTDLLLEDLLALSLTFPGHCSLAVHPAHPRTCKGK